jgi:hypothetical protein
MKREPVHTIINWLMMGGSVKLDGREFQMDEEYNLCIETPVLKLGNTKIGDKKFKDQWEKRLIKVDYSVGAFIRMCRKVSEEEFFTICANLTLNDVK